MSALSDPLGHDMRFLAQLVVLALGDAGAPGASHQDILKQTVMQSVLELQALERELDHLGSEAEVVGLRLEGIRKRLELASEGGHLLALLLRSEASSLAQTYAEYRAENSP